MSTATPPPSTMPPIDTRYRHIIAIALPVLLANLAMPLQSVIDTAIVGNMNDTAKLAGMGLAIQLLSLLLVSFNFLQYASSGLSAQALGQLASSTENPIKRVVGCDTLSSFVHPTTRFIISVRYRRYFIVSKTLVD